MSKPKDSPSGASASSSPGTCSKNSSSMCVYIYGVSCRCQILYAITGHADPVHLIVS